MLESIYHLGDLGVPFNDLANISLKEDVPGVRSAIQSPQIVSKFSFQLHIEDHCAALGIPNLQVRLSHKGQVQVVWSCVGAANVLEICIQPVGIIVVFKGVAL